MKFVVKDLGLSNMFGVIPSLETNETVGGKSPIPCSSLGGGLSTKNGELSINLHPPPKLTNGYPKSSFGKNGISS